MVIAARFARATVEVEVHIVQGMSMDPFTLLHPGEASDERPRVDELHDVTERVA